MKKSFLLLPVSIAILTACSSNSPAPIENVDGTLSPGVDAPPVATPDLIGPITVPSEPI